MSLRRETGYLAVINQPYPTSTSTNASDTNYFIVFVIMTLSCHITTRDAIRETWANSTNWNLTGIATDRLNFKLLFVVGDVGPETPQKTQTCINKTRELFLKELDEHDDVLYREELVESRQVLKYKVQTGIDYALTNYNFSFLVKTDDDVTVNLPQLLRGLGDLTDVTHLYAGTCFKHPAYRDRYCSGGGYLLSRDLAEATRNLSAAQWDPQEIPLPEDANTGFLVDKVRQTGEKVTILSGKFDIGRGKCFRPGRWFYLHKKHQTTVESHQDLHNRIRYFNSSAKCSR